MSAEWHDIKLTRAFHFKYIWRAFHVVQQFGRQLKQNWLQSQLIVYWTNTPYYITSSDPRSARMITNGKKLF